MFPQCSVSVQALVQITEQRQTFWSTHTQERLYMCSCEHAHKKYGLFTGVMPKKPT